MNSKKRKIVVIGSYLVALVMDSERIPFEGETLMARNFRQVHGGKGSNQAVQAARLGADTWFVGRIGNDSFGDGFLKLCKDENINSYFVYRSSSMPTGVGFIICSANGHNIITIDIAAINEFGRDDINKALNIIDGSCIVLLQLEIPLDTALYAAKKAKEKGAIVIFNPAPAKDLSGFDLSTIDYLTPNESEARVCLGLSPDAMLSDSEAAQKLLNLGCSNVILTLGEKGCFLCNKKEMIEIPAFKVDQVIDSTGAGDAFNGALALALSEDKPVLESLLFANAAGALSVTKADTIPSFHLRKEIELFLATKSDPDLKTESLI